MSNLPNIFMLGGGLLKNNSKNVPSKRLQQDSNWNQFNFSHYKIKETLSCQSHNGAYSIAVN